MKTMRTLLLMLAFLSVMLLAFPPQSPDRRGLLVSGTDMFWQTFDDEFYIIEESKLPDIPSEDQAAAMLRLRGYEVD